VLGEVVLRDVEIDRMDHRPQYVKTLRVSSRCPAHPQDRADHD
jgi:hypothetical protein